MRMSAEAMKRNGVILACVQELQERGVDCRNVEQLACLSGYSEQNVEKALDSLEKQNMLPEPIQQSQGETTMTTNEINTAIESIDAELSQIAIKKNEIERGNSWMYLYSRKKQNLVKMLKELGLKSTGNMEILVNRLLAHYEKEIAQLDSRISKLEDEKYKLASELKELENAQQPAQDVAYRHSWGGSKLFYYHQSCVERNPPEDGVTFEQISLSTVPQGVQCDCCYKPMHDKTVQKYPDGSTVLVNGIEWTVLDMSRDSEGLLLGQEDRGEDYNLYRLIRHNAKSIFRWQYELDAEHQKGKVKA